MTAADLYVKINALPEDLRKQVIAFIDRIMGNKRPEKQEQRQGGIPGLAKGRIIIPDDFDEPLDDFKSYME